MAISQVGLLARSPEGHAARGMPIKGHETSWVTIQTHTFTNWVNEQLRHTGLSVSDLSRDFADGTRLCALIESLQRRKLVGWARKPTNQHQHLENVSVALNAVAEDGVRLVNIGNVDIVNGNLKLILGLIWSLIVRYQIGRSKFPPKKLMLAWLRAVLPDCQVTNFTTDWNSGVYLSALVDYCQPGTFPHWQNLNPHSGVENCEKAMEVARSRLGVPQILEPEYLASPYLDELSGMTYLSYFMKENSPGFRATLRWVNSRIPPHKNISNFTSDWEDGSVLCSLVSSLGITSKCRPGSDPITWEQNLSTGIEAGRKLGVEPLLRAKDMTGQHVEHLGVMAYAAAFQWITPRPPADTLLAVSLSSHSTRVFQQTSVKLDFLDDDLDKKVISAEVTGPEGEKVFSRLALNSTGGKLIFTPTKIGMHEVRVMYDGDRAKGSPAHIRAMPELTTVKHTGVGMQPCAVGSIVEVLVHSIGPGEASPSEIEVRAYSPTGRWLDCPVGMKDGGYSATFQPDEPGLWTIQVKHSGSPVHDDPYTCLVYDPNGIKLLGIEESEKIHRLRLDTSGTCGVGEILFDVVRDRVSVPHTVQRPSDSVYEVTLHTHKPGKYRIYAYFNGTHIKGSPFPFRVGSREHMRGERLYSSHESQTQNSHSSLNSHNLKTHNSHHTLSSPAGIGRHSPLNSHHTLSSPAGIGRHSPLNSHHTMSSSVGLNNHAAVSTHQSGSYSTHTLGSQHPSSSNSHHIRSTHSPSNTHNVNSASSHMLNSSHTLNSMNSSHTYDTLSKTTTTTLNETQETYYRRSVISPTHSPIHITSAGHVNGYRSPLGRAGSPLDSPPSPVEVSVVRGLTNSPLGHTSPLGGHTSPLGGHTSPLGGGHSSPLGGHTSPLGHTSQLGGHTSPLGHSSPLNSHSTLLRVRSPSPNVIFHSIHSSSSSHKDCKVLGEALKHLPLHRTSTLVIDTDAPLSQITVTITPPSKSPVPVKMSRSNSSHVNIYFTATEIGEHLIDIKISDQRITGSPFRSQAYSAQAIKVGRIPNGTVGLPVEFEIDGRSAGSGNLEILVNGGHVTSFVRNLGGQRFLASFVPYEPVTHTVEMKFNAETVPGSPWLVGVMSSVPGGGGGPKIQALGEAVRLVPVGLPCSFQLSALGYSAQDVSASVLSPSKRMTDASVLGEGRGLFRLELIPREVGSHVVEVTVAGERLPGGPLVAKAYDSSLIRVTDVPSGVVGQPCQFRVDASEAGEGQLEISINEGEVPNHVTVVGGGRCLVSFTPEHNKPHLIDIKFNGETVSGCPFVCSVADTSKVSLSLGGLELIPVNQSARFHMNVEAGGGSAELAVSVRGPDSELPVSVTGSVTSGFTAEFTPRSVGPHTLSVLYNGQPVSGTPFTAKAYDASTVYVGPLPHGRVGSPLQFTVDASQAGEGNLEITISARGVNVPTQVQPQGNARFLVSFVPLEPTTHIVTIHFNQEPVPGSPFSAMVTGDFPLVSGSSLSTAQLGSDSHFTMSNITSSFNDVQVSVEGPGEILVPVQVRDAGSQTATVHFSPKVVGEHKISVSYRQVPVAGSPFTCKVYDVNAIKVKPVSHGTVGQPVTFLVETREAGPGNLEVTVNQGRVGTTAHTQGPHTYAISFTPRTPTIHTVHLKFNQHDVPGSPFSVEVNDVGRVVTPSEDKVSVGKSASFLVDCGSLGPPHVQIMSAMRNAVPATITQQGKHYLVSFTPKHVGDHSIEVKLSSNHVEGSPFLLKAYDATKVKVTDINSGPVGKPIYFSINASEAGAGNLEIIVAVNGRNVPNYVQSEGNAKFRVNFKPKEPSQHSLSVRFNGEPIPGSPFTCQVFERGEVMVWGAGVKTAQAAQPVSLQMGCVSESTEIRVTSPTGHRLPVKITTDQPTSTTTATFTPIEVGRHTVVVEVDGHPVKGSPFHCNVYNVNNIKVSGLGPAKVGKAVTFSVDATEAGEGTLELVISTQATTVKAEVNAVSRGLYDVTFVPHLVQPHYVNITFNDHDVPGSPLRCEVSDGSEGRATATARGEGLSSVVLGQIAFFQVNPHSIEPTPIDAFVTGPDGVRVGCRVDRLETGLYRGQYRPTVVGPHSLTITQDSRPITKHPFTVHVFDPTAVRIFDLSQAICGTPATFKVDTNGAGSGALSVVLRAAGQEVKHTLRELDTPGLYQVIYHPHLSTTHKIHLKYNNVYPPGSPLEVEVEDPGGVCAKGVGLYQATVMRPSTFVIQTTGQPSDGFDVIVTGPGSTAVPVRCYQQKDGNLMAEFTPTTIGGYKVEVLHNMRGIRGSPFYCQVFDASKVRVENHAGTTVAVNDDISFKLSRKDAGFGELEVTCRSPLGQDLPLAVQSLTMDSDLIEFCPSVPGKYAFHISYGGLRIPESPVVFDVEEGGWARAWGNGLSRARVGSEAKFEVSGGYPVVNITAPGGVELPSDVAMVRSDHHTVTWTPVDSGPHDITVLTHTGQHVPGSPFRATVVALENVRPVHTLQPRIIATVGMPYKLLVDITHSGPGDLVGECTGPGGRVVPCEVHSLGVSKSEVVFTPSTPGPHTLAISYAGFPLDWSPLSILAEAPSGGVRLVLTGKGLASATTDQLADFTIDGSQAGPGIPEVTLAGMKAEIKVHLQKLSENVYRATYTPIVAGAYLLNVMWSDRQVKGCPLKVTVTATSDASKVLCSGEGLGVGTVGKHIRSFIDTRAAGPGELSAHCVGPGKVAYCELYDHGDGTFTLNVKPQEPGRHTLTVKYAGVDVPGSPFLLRVAGPADASRVRVYGPGVQHGVLATFQSRFMCDTRGAGAGQLSVRVRGPKGAFRVEMQRGSQKDRLIMCKYDPTEPGDYRVEVKWAGDLVPGSPFPVMIFDTQEELNKFLQGNGSPTNEIYGSVAYSTGYAHITA